MSGDLCTIRKCTAIAQDDGLCEAHLERRRRYGECTVPDCDKPITRPALGWCEKHFYRHYRHGDVDIATVRPRRVFRRQDRGYVLLHEPDHPLSNGGWVYEHRLVLYRSLGAGPQECWWCGIEVRWGDGLQVDHLDHDRSNNDPSNLVPTCQPCNQGRGAGCDPDGWAIALAVRRILRRHAAEFATEVQLMRTRVDVIPYEGGGQTRPQRLQQMRRASIAAYDEVIANKPRGRWAKKPPGAG